MALFSTRDAKFESQIPNYLNVIAGEPGPSCIRGFSSFPNEINPTWNSYQFEDGDYLEHIRWVFGLMRERRLTPILVVQPYHREISDDRVRWLVRNTAEFRPIYEAINEPSNNERQRQIVEIVQSEGIPNDHIQVEWADEGAFFDLLGKTLHDEGLATLHGYGTMRTITAPHPQGWTESPGTLYLMTIGLHPSSDGSTDGTGLRFPWPGGLPMPTADEAREVLLWSLSHYNEFTGQIEKGRGYELLDPIACLGPGGWFPDLDFAAEHGRAMRRALRMPD